MMAFSWKCGGKAAAFVGGDKRAVADVFAVWYAMRYGWRGVEEHRAQLKRRPGRRTPNYFAGSIFSPLTRPSLSKNTRTATGVLS